MESLVDITKGGQSAFGPSGGTTVYGESIFDFGPAPGVSNAAMFVGIAQLTEGARAKVWIKPINTADHTFDEHIIDPPNFYIGYFIAGVGFTVYGVSKPNQNLVYGQWSIAWEWSS